MSNNSIIVALEQVAGDNMSQALPTLEAYTRSQPAWVTPIVALAKAAESIGDWSSAFELWTQARRIAPQSEYIDEGVKRSSLGMALPNRSPDTNSAQPAEKAAEDRQDASSLVSNPNQPADSDLPTKSTSLHDEDASESGREPGESAPKPLNEPFDFDITDLASSATTLSSTDSSKSLDELDNLIDRLEGARIIPRDDAEKVPAPDLHNDVDDMVSETLATIYLNQQQYGEAARVFDRLAELHPDKADEFAERATEARAKQAEQAKK